MTQTIPPAEAVPLQSLITPTVQGIASRILAKASGGSFTPFVVDKGAGTRRCLPHSLLIRQLFVADGRVENVEAQVDALIASGLLRRLLALTELQCSNSLIEACDSGSLEG